MRSRGKGLAGIALALLLVTVVSMSEFAQDVTALLPEADTYVHQENPTTNYGTDEWIEVGSQQNANRRAFLRFDLSGIAGTIDKATLQLSFYWGRGHVDLRDGDVLIEVCAVDNDTWGETGLTWTTAPVVGSVQATSEIGTYRRISFDITDWVVAQAAGNGLVSVAVRFSHEDFDATNRRIRFRSREEADDEDKRPLLTVTSSEAILHTILLSASPPHGGLIQGDGEYPDGTKVTVTATPNEGYAFSGWRETDVQVHTEPAYTFVINEDRQLEAQFTLCGCDPCPPVLGDWEWRSSSPKAGGVGQTIVGTDSHIYVLRAYTTGVYDFWSYSPAANTWTDLAIPPERPKNGTSLAWDGSGSLYALLGGAYTVDSDRSFFYRYSLLTDSWTRLEDSPNPQGPGNALTWSYYDNHLYAFLGSNDLAHGHMFVRYDPATVTWEPLPSNPDWDGTDDGAALAWTGGEWIYALRGEWDETDMLRDFARYHIPTSTWQQLPDIPDPDGVGDAASLLWIGASVPERESCLLALGGGGTREEPGYGFFVYDMLQGTWSTPAEQQLPCPVGEWTGNRLAFTEGDIWYWQGSPTTWDCGGAHLYSLSPISYTITATAGDGGGISPSGSVVVARGDSRTFTITPNAGCEIDAVLVDGASVAVLDTYTFNNVTSDHAVHATFRVTKQTTLTVHVIGSGEVAVDGVQYSSPVVVDKGTELKLVASPVQGSIFMRWEDGSANAVRAIIMNEDTTVTAIFRIVADVFVIAPHPVPADGCVFWLNFPDGTAEATLAIFSVDGVRVAHIEFDPSAVRYPAAGRWMPEDTYGRVLGTGLYMCLVELRSDDGSLIHTHVEKMVISR